VKELEEEFNKIVGGRKKPESDVQRRKRKGERRKRRETRKARKRKEGEGGRVS
jgi:hypothetical protein